MKIACQSCQAKYTIADEKVVGKVVKIRCKKCGATIVVNGQDAGDGAHGGAAAEEHTEVRSSPAEFNAQGGAGDGEPWTVNVADDDQRTMTTQQVIAEFSQGTITDETFCWRDGMGDWLPLREIEELSAACGLTAASAFARQSAPPPQAQQARAAVAASTARSGSVRPAASGGGGGMFGSSPPGAMGGSAGQQQAAAARRAGGRAGGADLFGAAAEAGGENDVMTSAPQGGSAGAVVSDDGKMTGQRNENSVLFSLNALTASEPKKAGGNLLGAAEGDGSGLIDIRALSSAMASAGPKKANHADDIMNLGGGGAFSAALAAPVLTAPPLDSTDPNSPAAASNNKKIFMMFGGLAAILIVGMVIIFLMIQPKPPVATATTPEGPGSAAPPAASVASTAPASPSAAAPPPASAVAAADPAVAAAAAAAGGSKATAPSVGAKHASTGGGGGSPVAAYTPPPAAAPPSNNQSLDALMNQAAGGGSKPAAPAAAAAGTNPFDRGAAAATLGGIAEGVGSCKKPGGPTGDGHVSITFAPSGGVTSAIVDQPPFAGTAVGGCVAGKFRGAHVPAFSGGSLTIGKRFSIN